MRKLFLAIVGLGLVAAVAGAAAWFWMMQPVALTTRHFVEISRGTSTRAIANQLARDGVVRSPWSLLVLRGLHPGSNFEAGEYEFSGSVSPRDAFDKIRLGQIYYQEVTVPEGSNMFDIAALLQSTGMIDPAQFLQAAKNPSLVKDLDPRAPSLEGYLFPSTYRLTHKITAIALCRTMTQEFRRQWNSVAGSSSGNVHRTVTLASLVEKETAIPAERPLVAAVFGNRLALNMPLQCDPTTVYAALVENRYRGAIHKSDLASSNAYNTYAHLGLPPGPIANPGVQAVKAALDPAKTSVLYFVAKGDGTGSHHFSNTLAEHDLAVARYRKTQH